MRACFFTERKKTRSHRLDAWDEHAQECNRINVLNHSKESKLLEGRGTVQANTR